MDKTKAKTAVNRLAEIFADKPALKFGSPYQLLVAVMLSAQCTDERVNKVTEKLFSGYGTPEKMLTLSQKELESYIFSCGLYRTKALHILAATKDIVEKFSGQVPETLEELRTLAGVGRKTANVVYSVAFGGAAIAVDTHVFRVSARMGLAHGKNPSETEKGLMEILDKSDWSRAHHYLIYLGRSYCGARKPDCKNCPVNDICEWEKKDRNVCR